jgi:murein DD-endopeptidase MepM/ murein hydrolase activator NlpD
MRKVFSFTVLLSLILITNYSLLIIDVSASLIDDLRGQIDQKEAEIKELEQKAAEYKQELQNTQAQKNTLNNQITLVESRIRKLRNDIYLTSAKIDNTSLRIEELSLRIGDKENEIIKKKDSIAEMIRALHEQDQTSLIEIVLTRDNLSDFVNQMRYIELLQEGVHNDMVILQELKQEMETDKQDAEQKRNQLYSLNNQLYSQKQIEDSEKNEKNYLLIKTKGQEKQYQSLLDDVLRQQQEIHKEIYDLEFELQSLVDPSKLPEAGSGVLSWPLDGILTQNYGITPYSQRLYRSGFHNGIDIASSYGEPVKAAMSGEVLAIGSCGRYAYGKWIAVKHPNGLTTFYAHLSNYAKGISVGDNIQRGQTIAYEGSTGYSTGAHLHFGVYVTETFRVESKWYGQLPLGAHLNPMKYL